MFNLTLDEQLRLISQAVTELEKSIEQLQSEFESLEHKERLDATDYWRKGIYLYLIYPMQNGNRRREYIGSDPEKQKEALQKIANHRRYVDLKHEIEYQRLCLREIQANLDGILWRLKGIQLPLWKELVQ